MGRILFCLVLLTGASASAAPWESSWRQDLAPFFSTYCAECHQGADAAGELDLDTLSTDLTNAESMRKWVLVHDRISSGEMPPDDNERPPKPALRNVVARVANVLTAAAEAQSDVVLRRLNRREYENTVRDLFDTDVRVKDILPQDNAADGFDNIGDGLAVSAEAAQAYLRAADIVISAALGPPVEPKRINHVTNLLDQKTFDGKPALAKQYGKMFRKTDDGLVIFQSGYCPTNLVNFSRLRAPVGTYTGTMRVRAVQSQQPVTLRIYGGDTIVGRREKHLVGYYDVPPDEWTVITFTDQLVEAGGTYQPKCYGTKDTRKDADTYPEPGIEIAEITIKGPLEEWPPISRRKLLAGIDPQAATIRDAKTILTRIATKAFRRDVSDEEVQPFVDLVDSALKRDRDFIDALRIGLKGILCAPGFLYLDEPGEHSVDEFAVAARLSYFLWSSMPDDELIRLAQDGKISESTTLRSQVERMLLDERANALTENFVGQWLNLRDIDFTNPDTNLYPEFDELLRNSMVSETGAFFQEILNNDLSIMNFVDSKFAMLNERLAKHYRIPGVRGQRIRKVVLADDSLRGGVLTQASVLKVTANGTTTSPVLRGAWVMDKILGETVPPPPSNVPAVEPDIRGAVTLREQLAKHRNAESCAVCHRKIDPAGFALEEFDVIGGYREEYRTLGDGRRPEFGRDPHTFAWIRYRIGQPVDATGFTYDGKPFADIRDFKQILLANQDSVATGLTKKLLTYALGRRLGFSDRPHVQRIVQELSQRDYGLRSLIHEIVQSDVFRQP